MNSTRKLQDNYFYSHLIWMWPYLSDLLQFKHKNMKKVTIYIGINRLYPHNDWINLTIDRETLYAKLTFRTDTEGNHSSLKGMKVWYKIHGNLSVRF